jgi:hypothetical protein
MGDITRDERRAIASERRRAIALDRCIDVYSADTSLGYRLVRQVTALYAFNKVAEGQWQEIFDSLGNFRGVKMLAAVKSDQELPSGTSATTITARDKMLFAGLGGPSRTIGRDENYRITRYSSITGKALPPEDSIERVIAKVQQWPFPASRIDNGREMRVFGDRAIRCYPHTKPRP